MKFGRVFGADRPGFDEQRASEILFTIGELVLSGVSDADEEWSALATVLTMHRQKSMFGYAYFEDGSWSADLSLSIEILDRAAELRSAMSVPGKKDWKSCLIQIKRSDMQVKADFEYRNESRWRITPGNIYRMIENLRPL